MILRLSQFIFNSSRAEYEHLQAEGIPLSYEQKIRGDRMVTVLLIAVLVLTSVIYSVLS